MLTIDPEEAEIVKFIFQKHKEGVSMLGTTELLEQAGYKTRKGSRFQTSTVKSILSNKPLYEGMYKYGDMNWVRGVHEPILKGE